MLDEKLDQIRELINNLEDLEEEKDRVECDIVECEDKQWYHNPAFKFDKETELKGIEHKIKLYNKEIVVAMTNYVNNLVKGE